MGAWIIRLLLSYVFTRLVEKYSEVLTDLVKEWLMAEKKVPKEETPEEKMVRLKREMAETEAELAAQKAAEAAREEEAKAEPAVIEAVVVEKSAEVETSEERAAQAAQPQTPFGKLASKARARWNADLAKLRQGRI